MDRVSTESVRDVAEVNLRTGERRSLLDGGEPFDRTARGIARIVIPGDSQAAVPVEELRDSILVLLVPTTDIDSDEVFTVRLDFYSGPRPAVLLGSSEAVPRPVLDLIVQRIETLLLDANFASGDHLDLAWDADGIGLRVLRDRTRRIEQSVRDALADDHLTDEDYRALRDYPARLARVEKLALKLADSEPEKHSFKPPAGRFDVVMPRVEFFHKWAGDVGDDAREAVMRLSGLLSSQQIVLTQRQAEETARFQRLVTIVGAAVLVPGLVAAIFGANVGFPGRGTTEAFWAMLILMAGSGLASFAAIRSFETDLWTDLAKRRVFAWVGRSVTDKVRVGVCALVAVLALGGGIGLLMSSDSPAGSSSRASDSEAPAVEARKPATLERGLAHQPTSDAGKKQKQNP